MKSIWVCLLVLTATLCSCNARMSIVGEPLKSKEGTTEVDPPPPPPPPIWPEGKLYLDCQLEGPTQVYSFGKIGMIDGTDEGFVDWQNRWVKYADEGWVAVDAYFVDHNSQERPIRPPQTVEVEYYIFLRPDWHVPENFYEIRRKVRIPFRLGRKIHVGWKFTDHSIECGVEALPEK